MLYDFLILITGADTLTSLSSHLKRFAHLRAADNRILPESLIQSTPQTYGSPEDELLGEEIHTPTHTHSITFLSYVSLCSVLIWRLARRR